MKGRVKYCLLRDSVPLAGRILLGRCHCCGVLNELHLDARQQTFVIETGSIEDDKCAYEANHQENDL